MPIFDPKEYRLEIGGLVRKPQSFTYDELLALPRAHQVSTFHCVTGWTVHDVRWSGVRLRAPARPRRAAARREGAPLRLARAALQRLADDRSRPSLHDVMLALEMDGQPLSRPHGSPARVVIPEMYGYKGVKWLTKIELVAHQPTGYWEGLGYDQDAWVGRSNGYGI